MYVCMHVCMYVCMYVCKRKYSSTNVMSKHVTYRWNNCILSVCVCVFVRDCNKLKA